MGVVSNKARQLITVRGLLEPNPHASLQDAIASAADLDGAVSERLRDELTARVLVLPSQVLEQATALVPKELTPYLQEVTGFVHRTANVYASMLCLDYLNMFDRPTVLAMTAIAHLVDREIGLVRPTVEEVAPLQEEAYALLMAIDQSDELDPEAQDYLVRVASHLREVLQHLDVFGVDGLLDVQGRFIAEVANWHRDLVPLLDDEGGERTPAQCFSDRLWRLMVNAAVVTGLTTDAIALGHTVLALKSGR